MSQVIESLLDTLAAYPGTPDEASLTLPSAAYTDPGLHEIERETISKHEWLLIGRASDIPDPRRLVYLPGARRAAPDRARHGRRDPRALEHLPPPLHADRA